MISELQYMIGVFHGFLLCNFLGLMVMVVIGYAGLRSLNLRNSNIAWFGVFLCQGKRATLILTLLVFRFLYLVSMIWSMKELSIYHVILYIGLEIIIMLLVFRPIYMIYNILYCLVNLAMVYVYSLLYQEVHKVEYQRGMQFLYYGIAFFLIIAAICQCLIGFNQLTQKQQGTKTDMDHQIRLISGRLLVTFVMVLILPFYVVNSIASVLAAHGGYQIVDGVHVDYDGACSITKADTQCMMDWNNQNILLQDTPFYFNDESKILLTQTYSIVQPRLALTNRVNKLSTISWDQTGYHVTEGSKVVDVDDFFLFDGKDTYYFPANTELTWENESVKINTFCQVVVKYNQSVEIYDLSKDTYTQYLTGNCYCIATLVGNERVNLSTDILYRIGDKEQMLFLQPSFLSDLE